LIVKTISVEKNKERISKFVSETWQVTYRGKSIIVTAVFSTETIKSSRAWNEVFLKKNN
jgi:hypothetical protein